MWICLADDVWPLTLYYDTLLLGRLLMMSQPGSAADWVLLCAASVRVIGYCCWYQRWCTATPVYCVSNVLVIVCMNCSSLMPRLIVSWSAVDMQWSCNNCCQRLCYVVSTAILLILYSVDTSSGVFWGCLLYRISCCPTSYQLIH